MKLLFDENLSRHLPQLLADIFPESAAAIDVGLGGASDDAVWKRARADDFVLVTKDEYFQRLSVLPPSALTRSRIAPTRRVIIR